MSPELTLTVLEAGLAAGLDRVGVCEPASFPEVRASLEERRESGMSAGLTFTFSRPAVASDPGQTFPWARSLVVGGRSYLPEAGDPGPPSPGSGRIARFAVADYYEPLDVALQAVAATLGEAGMRSEVIYDDGRLVDRAVAERAGVGWWGKNTMILAPDVGPWMLLGAVATDAVLDRSQPMRRDCGTCSACLPACPTGALVAPGVLDARRCLAALAQLPGPIPVEYRTALGDRLYGCDECLDACPPGGRRLESAKEHSAGRVDLVRILETAPESVAQEFRRFYLPGRDGRFLQRNALVALGNTGGAEHVALLARHLESGDPLLASHAAWALGRIGGGEARAALEAARPADPQTSDEIASALSMPAPSGK